MEYCTAEVRTGTLEVCTADRFMMEGYLLALDRSHRILILFDSPDYNLSLILAIA